MKVKVIGCGNFNSKINYNQAFLISEDGRNMLFDCGNRIPMALYNAKIPVTKIDDIYISHPHGDHIGGLEEIAFERFDWAGRSVLASERKSCPAPTLIANAELMKNLWDKSLCGGLESMEGFDANLATYFNLRPIHPNEIWDWQGWKCKLIQQVHIMTGSVIASTFGLFMSKAGYPSVYFTADSQHCSPKQVEIFYKEAGIIFQDTECFGVDTKNRKFVMGSGVHANYAQLAGWASANATVLNKEIRNKMLLSHYQDFVSINKDYLGNYCDWEKMAQEDGFHGFVKVGMVIEILPSSQIKIQ